MPPMRFNSNEAAIIDGEIQQLLCKVVLEETAPSSSQYIDLYHFAQKKKNGSNRLILNLKGLNE